MRLTAAELFAGIGGFSLGFEWAGIDIAWQCEIEPYAQAVLEKHWPHIPVYQDVRQLKGVNLEKVDILAGGFPCQDISTAGKGAGIQGRRSGLWSEFARLVGELEPRYVVVENVAALKAKGRGLGRVLADLAALGYDAEWDCLPASAFGAPHRRDRIWIVAYPHSARQKHVQEGETRRARFKRGGTACGGSDRETSARYGADPDGQRPQRFRPKHQLSSPRCQESTRRSRRWGAEPDMGRVAYGIPSRVDRLTHLGNALVPQIAAWIGGRIVEWEELHGGVS